MMTTGDAQLRPESQNPASLNGKILRLNLDGTIPANNPTPGSAVYTLGHRNPQGLTRAPSGKLYSAEHGEAIDDEVNLIEAGRNYGWPNIEGPCNIPAEQAFCTANNVREPLTSYTPTLGVSGLAYYTHPAIPEWNNSLLLLSLKAGTLTRLQLNAAGDQVTSQNNVWAGAYGRLRAVCVSPQGRIYIGTSNRDGRGNAAATDDRILVLENRGYTLSTANNSQSAALAIWPNPATSTVTVRLPAPATTSLVVRDALGRAVQTVALAGRQETTLDVRHLPAGLYTVQTQLGTTQFTRRLVVE
jgi:glucose/arabinose dehydrogenase